MSFKTSILTVIFLCSLLNERESIEAISNNDDGLQFSFMFSRTDSFHNSDSPEEDDLESQLKDITDGCGNNRRIIGYVTNWSTRSFTAKQAQILTNAIYSFVEMNPSGHLKLPEGLDSENRLNQLMTARRVLTKNGKDFKVSFAIGGWEDSAHFSSVLNQKDLRSSFVTEIKRIIDKYEFDGVDIDWEFPITGGAKTGIPEDRANYVAFLGELRQKLGKNRLISIAAGAGTEAFTGFDVKNIIKYVDWIGVMSYDFFGAWQSKWGAYVGPNAPLYHSAPPGYSGKLNVNWAMKQYSCISGKPNKIIMGIPFYGRFWHKTIAGKDQKDFPIFRTAEIHSDGTYGGSAPYWQLLNEWKINSDSSYRKYWDTKSMTPWASKNSLIVSYENDKSIAAKVEFANKHNLGGVMIWSVDQDDNNKLLDTVYKGLCHVSVGNANVFKCNPLGEEKRWWTTIDDKDKAGMCGRNAPLFKGYYPVCDPDDPGYSCCSGTGFCGTGSSFCDCPKCVDYGKNPNALIKEPVKPSRSVDWHVGFDIVKSGNPRCGPKSQKVASGKEAICNPDGDDFCCSPAGYCGSGKDFCECNGCVNYRTTKQ